MAMVEGIYFIGWLVERTVVSDSGVASSHPFFGQQTTTTTTTTPAAKLDYTLHRQELCLSRLSLFSLLTTSKANSAARRDGRLSRTLRCPFVSRLKKQINKQLVLGQSSTNEQIDYRVWSLSLVETFAGCLLFWFLYKGKVIDCPEKKGSFFWEVSHPLAWISLFSCSGLRSFFSSEFSSRTTSLTSQPAGVRDRTTTSEQETNSGDCCGSCLNP